MHSLIYSHIYHFNRVIHSAYDESHRTAATKIQENYRRHLMQRRRTEAFHERGLEVHGAATKIQASVHGKLIAYTISPICRLVHVATRPASISRSNMTPPRIFNDTGVATIRASA